MEQRETIGILSTNLLKNAHENTHSAHDQMQESLTDYDANITLCLETNKKEYPGDFYIVVITKKERLLKNVLRNYFTARLSCPTPDYDQTVYHYHRLADHLEFLWVIPSKDTCIMMKENFLTVPTEEKELLKFVLDFADGTLFKLAKKRNGEELNSPLLIT